VNVLLYFDIVRSSTNDVTFAEIIPVVFLTVKLADMWIVYCAALWAVPSERRCT